MHNIYLCDLRIRYMFRMDVSIRCDFCNLFSVSPTLAETNMIHHLSHLYVKLNYCITITIHQCVNFEMQNAFTYRAR